MNSRSRLAALVIGLLIACAGAEPLSPSPPQEPTKATRVDPSPSPSLSSSLGRSASPTMTPTQTATATESSTPSATPVASPSPSPTRSRPPRPTAVVARVIDGDTIEVTLGARTVDVRLIGVDTPETVDPGSPVECYGKAASDFTQRALEGQSVRLEYDVERLDQYGRTLAYVWHEGKLFNEVLVHRGYADVLTIPPNVRYEDRFVQAYREARAAERGLWGECLEPAPTPPPSCDPSYPRRCIPPPPPDLDCADVGAQSFAVTGSDPHGFDGDGDGVGCEPAPDNGGDGGGGGGGGGDGDGGGGGCDPSYPDFCIPPSPPDLDCAQVSGSNFTVVGSDPHGFDGDGDGVGCES